MKKKFGFFGKKEDYFEDDRYEEEEYEELEDEYFAEDYEGEEEYYEQDAEYYADEEAEYDEEEYYADGEAVYYSQEDGMTGEEEYYSEEELPEDDEYYAEEEEWDVDELEYMEENEFLDPTEFEKSEDNIFTKLLSRFSQMDLSDRIVASTGIIVLILALVTGSIFMGTRMSEKQISTFADVGSQLEGIEVIGGDGLTAVADAEIARQEAASLVEEEEESEGYEEEEYSKEVTVTLKMTSIKKDLKIKFVNKKTGKLIPNVPFEVKVTNSKDETETWTDEDKDGIIYKTNITPGKYSVTVSKLENQDKYKISTAAQTVTVKENLDYEKVDVSDEIKSESEIDASREDTAQNNVQEESRLQDTVEWVESTQTPSGENYVEVVKATIKEPVVNAARIGEDVPPLISIASVNRKVTREVDAGGVSILGGGGTIGSDGTAFLQAEVTAPGTLSVVNYEWSVSPSEYASLSANTGESVTLTAKNTTDSEQTVTVSVTARVGYDTVSDGEVTQTYSASTTLTLAAAVKEKASISPASVTLAIGGTTTLTATVGEDSTGFTWASADTSVAVVDEKGLVTAKKVGATTITATHTSGVSATCTVTVTGNDVSIKLDKTSATLTPKGTLDITATIQSNLTENQKVTWTSSNEKVATVKGNHAKATVTAVKAGNATITATYTENDVTVTASCEITVQSDPKNDTSTALKDQNGNQIYVQNSQGNYVAATSADYYTSQKFYIKQQGYKYTGWQTLSGKVYYFDKNGNKVTGEQVIQGARYTFDSEGVLVNSNGVLGIDVSKWNGDIDWAAVKNSGVSYVIIRCGYRGSSKGALVEDPKFKANIKGATGAGLKVGVYFFSQAINEIEAVEEASMVLSLVKGYSLSYPIFLDVEPSGGRADGIDRKTRTAVCKAFCQTVQNSGYAAGVYANKTWFESYIDASQLGTYRIWLAQYAAAPTYGGRYDIWQYSSKGKISGIKGDVDLN